jgi:ribosomal protein S27AE
MAGKKHIHKYHKISLNTVMVWACALPNCSHYMPKHLDGMVLGKASYCWNCGNQMVLDSNNIEMDKPICINCAHPTVDPILDLTKKFNDINTTEPEKNDIAHKLMEVLKD